MRTKDLLAILQEYRPSMRLKILDDGAETGMEMAIATLVSTLLRYPADENVYFYGKGQCVIIRERGEEASPHEGDPPYRGWLEIDVRH